MSIFSWGRGETQKVAVPDEGLDRDSFGGESYGRTSLDFAESVGASPNDMISRATLVDAPTVEVAPRDDNTEPGMTRNDSDHLFGGGDFFTPPGESPRRDVNPRGCFGAATKTALVAWGRLLGGGCLGVPRLPHGLYLRLLLRADDGMPPRSAPGPPHGGNGASDDEDMMISSSRPPLCGSIPIECRLPSSAQRTGAGSVPSPDSDDQGNLSQHSSKGSWVGDSPLLQPQHGGAALSVSPILVEQSWTLMAGEHMSHMRLPPRDEDDGQGSSSSAEDDSPTSLSGELSGRTDEGELRLLAGEMVQHTIANIEWLRPETEPESLSTRSTPRSLDGNFAGVKPDEDVLVGALYITDHRVAWSAAAVNPALVPPFSSNAAASAGTTPPLFGCSMPYRSIDYLRPEEFPSNTPRFGLGGSLSVFPGRDPKSAILRLCAKDGRLLRLRFKDFRELTAAVDMLGDETVRRPYFFERERVERTLAATSPSASPREVTAGSNAIAVCHPSMPAVAGAAISHHVAGTACGVPGPSRFDLRPRRLRTNGRPLVAVACVYRKRPPLHLLNLPGQWAGRPLCPLGR